jgi:radical SAM superfamily enzyme YgiQ (UPF0313 family)
MGPFSHLFHGTFNPIVPPTRIRYKRKVNMRPTFVLINPWIYDFAAYDLWSKPIGLLYLAAELKKRGSNVYVIDCLDVHHPQLTFDSLKKRPRRQAFGTGKFERTRVPPPLPLAHISRPYSRYGFSRDLFFAELKKIEDPSAILVTSLMTYWYPGVHEVIKLAQKAHPGVPILLGGIYAQLCRDHALSYSGADKVVTRGDLFDTSPLVDTLEEVGVGLPAGKSIHNQPLFPAFELLSKRDYICLLTSMGCPYRCQYCASPVLNPRFRQRPPDDVIEEIYYWHQQFQISDFAFYDDALLINSEKHLAIILEGILRRGIQVRFHTPNALHIAEISTEIAYLLHRSGFKTIRLGLETSLLELHDRLDRKVMEGDFERAARNLKCAGFSPRELGAYILMGLPGQNTDSVYESIGYAGHMGIPPYLAEYSPLPGTALWDEAQAHSDYDLASEPLFHNNTLISCWGHGERREVHKLRRRARDIRRALCQ